MHAVLSEYACLRWGRSHGGWSTFSNFLDLMLKRIYYVKGDLLCSFSMFISLFWGVLEYIYVLQCFWYSISIFTLCLKHSESDHLELCVCVFKPPLSMCPVCSYWSARWAKRIGLFCNEGKGLEFRQLRRVGLWERVTPSGGYFGLSNFADR